MPPLLHLSSADTARFGLRIARMVAYDDRDDSDQIALEIEDNSFDFLIFRVPAGCRKLIHGMVRRGLTPTHADTLVYYRMSLAEWVAPATHNDYARFHIASAEDSIGIQTVANHGFANYKSHYDASPRLDPQLVQQGYVEWSTAYLDGGDTRFTCVAKRLNEVVGFLACTMDQEKQNCEVALNAVAPNHEGHGIYTQGLAAVMQTAKQRGMTSLVISTQVWNYRVQRVWARTGLELFQAYDTYHLDMDALHPMKPDQA